jgi:hypothetical protein
MPDEPGWYPDPRGEANFRFYDGRRWTKSLAAAMPEAVQEEQPPVVEGGLMGLLDVQPEFVPMEPEAPPPPRWASAGAQERNPNAGQPRQPAASQPTAPPPAAAPPPVAAPPVAPPPAAAAPPPPPPPPPAQAPPPPPPPPPPRP